MQYENEVLDLSLTITEWKDMSHILDTVDAFISDQRQGCHHRGMAQICTQAVV